MKKFSVTVFILIALVSLFGLQMFAKQDPKVQKKDTLKKEVKVVETLQEDSLIVPKGKYKIFKKTAHASYYADKFHGRRTASGKKYDKNGLTAAHKTLPFGTKVKVTNLTNGKVVVVEITDRGPFVKGREIDLSRKAFMSITHNRATGQMNVSLEILQK